MTNRKLNSRRRFLKRVAVGSLGAGMLASHGKLGLMQSALAAGSDYSALSDYKSLVCVYLFGGNDAFNMVIPNSPAGYQEYQNIRGPLSIDQGLLHPVTGAQHAFHPSMPNVRNLYNSGRLGLLANVGTLLEPTTRETYLNGTALLPPDLFSHSHQTEMWQTDRAPIAGITQDGWGGLMADLLQEANSNPLVPPTITLFGNNNWQAGRITQQLAMNTYNGAEPFLFLNNEQWPAWEASRTQAWDSLLNRPNTHPLANEAGNALNQAREQNAILEEALLQAPAINTTYNESNYFALQLRMVARMISVREYLGMKRQVFFVALGGWDTHGNQLNDHAAQLAQLDDGLASFNDNLDELAVADNTITDGVVSFTMSEFGRTLTANGDGTDHGWGTHCMMMGGPVAGGTIHGQMPTLQINGPDDAGNAGRMIPTTALDQYAATLGAWMGVTPGDLNEIFPNLNTFNGSDLGFLS